MQADARTSGAWWQTAFQAEYAAVYSHRNLEAARSEVSALIALGVRGRVLDLCCGYGRHLSALRRVGVDAFGLDWSMDLLCQAAALPDAGQIEGRLARGDMRVLPFRSASFDTIVCMFNSFGYFSDEENATVAREMQRVLRPDGRLFLDVMNAERVRRDLVPRTERALGADRLSEIRRITTSGTRVEKEIVLARQSGAHARWSESVRLYQPDELTDLLLGAGLAVEHIGGDLHGRPFDAQSERMLVQARVVPVPRS
jgi:SAM-dependent methyltransferase